jgi:hypothetical protein
MWDMPTFLSVQVIQVLWVWEADSGQLNVNRALFIADTQFVLLSVQLQNVLAQSLKLMSP